MIELALPPDAPESALDELRKIIAKHATGSSKHGEPIALSMGNRRLELGDTYRVDASLECLADLFRAIDAAV